MTDARKLTLEVIHSYFIYLSKWNKSASLVSVMNSVGSLLQSEEVSDVIMEELGHTADFEWVDTKTMTTDRVMSLNDIHQLIIKEQRNTTLEKILSK